MVMNERKRLADRVANLRARGNQAAFRFWYQTHSVLGRGWQSLVRDERGQGTTEYAILVGVLVVIAIVAIAAFRGKLQELWSAIANGINGL